MELAGHARTQPVTRSLRRDASFPGRATRLYATALPRHDCPHLLRRGFRNQSRFASHVMQSRPDGTPPPVMHRRQPQGASAISIAWRSSCPRAAICCMAVMHARDAHVDVASLPAAPRSVNRPNRRADIGHSDSTQTITSCGAARWVRPITQLCGALKMRGDNVVQGGAITTSSRIQDCVAARSALNNFESRTRR